ncbi:MAG: carboxypeptidase-like regulatory domain-containing protein [Bryobacteraceae bacterium]
MPCCRSFGWKLACALVAIASFGINPLKSQSTFGSIVGTVTDPSGAPMPGASASLTNNGTGEHRSMQTGNSGEYSFVNLVPGNYKVEVEIAGFKHYTRDNLQVQVESAVRVDVPMQVGELNQQIEVTAQTPILQTENASQGQVVQGRSVQELPLNGRNVLNLVALAPGVVPQGSSMTSLTGQNVF